MESPPLEMGMETGIWTRGPIKKPPILSVAEGQKAFVLPIPDQDVFVFFFPFFNCR